jgi:LMBR1 domain-containing protein 1
VYVIAIMSFFGWICVVICGGVGLFALPLDMINDFRNRPKARRTAEMNQTKKNLATAVNSLIKEGEEMKKVDDEHAANS